MTELIRSQAWEFIVMVGAGMQLMICLECAVFLRRRLRLISVARFSLEALFWVFEGFMVSAFLYYSNFGQLTVQCFCGLAIGVLLWKRFLYGIIAYR